MACQETWISEFTNLIVTCILTRVNSDEAVSSTNRFKAFTSKAFYGLLNSLKAAAIKVVELIFEALVYLLNRGKNFSYGVDFLITEAKKAGLLESKNFKRVIIQKCLYNVNLPVI
ncbi:uncharacterized protein LOC112020176 isoform X2 [Quercus suber]|uniref:uncharacterized protein LOC112020176 isoform X2 n=1 Tax=Quercus suber TaxID=58331 RepID=UPI0032DEE532